MELDYVNDKNTPITEKTFIKQGWERIDVSSEESGGEPYYFWELPLPKYNPDNRAQVLISTTNDRWEEIGLKKGEYAVEIFDFSGLGYCLTEEEIGIVYNVLTQEDVNDDNVSSNTDTIS